MQSPLINSETRQRLFNEGIEYISATKTRVLMSAYDCKYSKFLSVRFLPITETHSFNHEMGLWNKLHSFCSLPLQGIVTQAKYPFESSVTKGKQKKNTKKKQQQQQQQKQSPSCLLIFR